MLVWIVIGLMLLAHVFVYWRLRCEIDDIEKSLSLQTHKLDRISPPMTESDPIDRHTLSRRHKPQDPYGWADRRAWDGREPRK